MTNEEKNEEEKRAYEEAATARINEYHGRLQAFMKEYEEHFAMILKRQADGDYEHLSDDPQNIQESFELLEWVEDNDMEDEIKNYDKWRFSADMYLQIQALQKEGREIQRLSTTLLLNSCRPLVTDLSMKLQNGLKLRAEEGENCAVTLEDIAFYEQKLAHFQQIVMVNELHLTVLDDAALN